MKYGAREFDPGQTKPENDDPSIVEPVELTTDAAQQVADIMDQVAFRKKTGPECRASFRFLFVVLLVVLIATALLARDHATVVTFDRGGHHAAVSPWANGHAARANADSDI